MQQLELITSITDNETENLTQDFDTTFDVSPELRSLTESKDFHGIKAHLNNLIAKEKGGVFEHYLAFLLYYNGLFVRVVGQRNDRGADILVYNSEGIVTSIIQVKNHKSPLTKDQVRLELGKFESEGKQEHNCSFFQIFALNGYVKDANKLKRYNLSLNSWPDIQTLIEHKKETPAKTPIIDLNISIPSSEPKIDEVD